MGLFTKAFREKRVTNFIKKMPCGFSPRDKLSIIIDKMTDNSNAISAIHFVLKSNFGTWESSNCIPGV